LPLLFSATNKFSVLTKSLKELQFIHFAQWTVINYVPSHVAGIKIKLDQTLLYFESNFNGTGDLLTAEDEERGWIEYIEAFSYKLSRGMKVFWGSSEGFPGPVPVQPFMDYIKSHELGIDGQADHYYAAYSATTAGIERSLKQAGITGQNQASIFMAICPIKPEENDHLLTLLHNISLSPFQDLPKTHFARFVITDQLKDNISHLIFSSIFDGDQDQYLSDLSILTSFHEIFQRCIGCPKDNKPESLKKYLIDKQIKTGLFYAAYPQATVQQVREAIEKYPPATAWESNTPKVRMLVALATRLAVDEYESSYVPNTLATRDQHSTGHMVEGRLIVKDVPAEYQYGIFSESGEYDTFIRFSPNAPAPLKWGDDAHGMAVKIIVKDSEFDILTADHDVFLARNGEDTIELQKAKSKGFSSLIKHFFPGPNFHKWRLLELKNMIGAITGRATSYLGINYYTQIAVQYGPFPAKLSWRSMQPTEKKSFFKKTDLTSDLRNRLNDNGARFSLMVQKQDKNDPVDDPTVRWNGNFVLIAELFIPAQALKSGENMSWTLANAPEEHRALGSVSEIRMGVYRAISDMRIKINKERKSKSEV
jgi:hypothetical protein